MSDYPCEHDLKLIREWSGDDPAGWLTFIRGIWWMPDWGWSIEDDAHCVSTGGWSGNESIIAAMEDNVSLWFLTWESTRRGGHYEFRVRPTRSGA